MPNFCQLILEFWLDICKQIESHFWSVAKVALRVGCSSWNSNLESYLVLDYGYIRPILYVIDYIHYISVTMGALSGKVVIVIIACVSFVVISSIVIPLVIIYSGVKITKNIYWESIRNSTKYLLLQHQQKQLMEDVYYTCCTVVLYQQ